jgi:exodeoxyribonuclease V beta subunit
MPDHRAPVAASLPAFDLTGQLPTGLTALEASAGTGKTYALSALAVRYVAEALVPASGLCVVSFTEAATAELRGRIRSRLVEAADHLSRPGPDRDAADDPGDPLLAHLDRRCGDDAERQACIVRLRTAVADFDAATISTIHGFCRRVLAMSSGATDRAIVNGDTDVDEVVNDLLLAALCHDDQTLIRADRVASAVRARLTMPESRMHRPDPPPAKPRSALEPHQRLESLRAADLVEAAVVEVLRRREAAHRRTFDGLLRDARSHLCHPDHGPALVRLLRDRFRVVLVDEFQDTDRVQWDIFRTAFVDGHEPRPVVLVGDPKQSIYRFRSADIYAYLDAKRTASQQASLSTNWRSDAPLLRGLATLFQGQTFGSDDVVFQPVDAAPGRDLLALVGAGPASVQLRVVSRGADEDLVAGQARKMVRRDVVGTVADLLSVGAGIIGSDGSTRPLLARDIAVLTLSNHDANVTALDLATAGIPAATSSASSVLDTDAAMHWRLLLRALVRPRHPGTARAAALSWFVGHDLARIAAYDDTALAELHDQLRRWSDLVTTAGLPRLLAEVRSAGLNERLLSQVGGDRALTDLDHITELLHAGTGGRPAGPSALLAALDHLAAHAADDETARDAVARRIDRDDDAVQVLTIHRAKGLEFPLVLCPYLWTSGGVRGGIPHAHVDTGHRELDSTWVADVPDRKWNEPLRQQARRERDGESRRLLYVAMTRARHRCIVWWASPSTNTVNPPLGQMLTAAAGIDTPPLSVAHLTPLVGRSGASIEAVEVASPPPLTDALAVPAHDRPPLSVSPVDRLLDHRWRIWSFSAMAAAAADLASEHADATATPRTGGHDEAAGSVPIATPDDQARVSADLWHHLPAGARFGTLVHRVFERCDFSSPTVHADLVELCADELVHQRLDVDPSRLADALVSAIDAPLGGPVHPMRLRDLTPTDRLDELDFHLPLAAGQVRDVGRVLVRHLAPDDAVQAWAHNVAERGFAIDVEGMLTGSIDLVGRSTSPDGTTRYWVADYKTNLLDPARPFDRAHLAEAMAHSHYPLQASLYLVALHRYLRQRLAQYHPAQHLAGAAYLFVRGMDPAFRGAEPLGVFWWTPAPEAILALDELLAVGGTP